MITIKAQDRKHRKHNFLKYCYCINYVEKKLLVNLLKWFYKGDPDESYFDYLLREYDAGDFGALISPSQIDDLRNKTASELDIRLLHWLMKLTCSLYDIIDLEEDCDTGYKILSDGIERIVMVHINLGAQTPCLSDAELDGLLTELKELNRKLAHESKKLGNINVSDHTEVIEDVELDIMSLCSIPEVFYYVFPKDKAVQKWGTLMRKKEEVKRIVSTMAAPEILGVDESYKEVLRHKFTTMAIRHRRLHRLKAAIESVSSDSESDSSGDKREDACQAGNSKTVPNGKVHENIGPCKKQHKEVVTVGEAYEWIPVCSGGEVESTCEEKGCAPEAGDSKIVQSNTVKGKFLTVGKKISETLNDAEMVVQGDLTLKISRREGESVPRESPIEHIERLNYNELGNAKSSRNMSCYKDTHVLLKQHQKYSHKPGQSVSLVDIFNVEGMNSDEADILLVSGEAGVGKTMLLEYISEMHKTDLSAVGKLSAFPCLFCCDMKLNDCQTLRDLVHKSICMNNLDPEVDVEFLTECTLLAPLILLLDDYDFSLVESTFLLKELFELIGLRNMKLIITCRPLFVDALYRLIPKSKRKFVCHLGLNVIPVDCLESVATLLIDNAVLNEYEEHSCRQQEIKKGLISRLPEILSIIGDDLCNPLLLKIIVTMWLENPQIG